MPDAPDWVRRVEVVVIVENVPVEPVAANEAAAGDIGNYAGTDQDYQTAATWTVSADKVGELKEILIISNDYTHTEARITIDGTVFETDWSPTSSMPIIFEDLRLEAGAVVLVEAQSTDGTAIDVDVVIIGKEIG